MFRDDESGFKLSIDEVIDMERAAGLVCGPFERRLILDRAPERARRYLARARRKPYFVSGPPVGIAGPVGIRSAAISSFAAISNTNSETNLWVPSIWTPIPKGDMQGGAIYTVEGGGVFSTSSAAPTNLWTPRVGQSGTPASNVTLGASTAVTMTASLSNVPFFVKLTAVIRALGLAASGAGGTGNGFAVIGDVTTTAGKIQSFGGTVASTIDNTADSGLIVSQTWGTAHTSNTLTCQWVTPALSLTG